MWLSEGLWIKQKQQIERSLRVIKHSNHVFIRIKNTPNYIPVDKQFDFQKASSVTDFINNLYISQGKQSFIGLEEKKQKETEALEHLYNEQLTVQCRYENYELFPQNPQRRQIQLLFNLE